MADDLALPSPVDNEQKPEGVRALIFEEINRERAAQDAQWGGNSHDDSHERFEWCSYIEKQNTRGSQVYFEATRFERRMVKVAALAVAAIESSRRERGFQSANAAESQPPSAPGESANAEAGRRKTENAE